MLGDLTAWEKVKEVLKLDDDQKELVEFLISASSSQAEKIADRFLSARDIDIKLDASGSNEYLLPSYPINSVELIEANGARVGADMFNVKSQSGILRLKININEGWEAVRFKGNLGYNTVPYDLEQAVIETISANLRRFAQSGGNVGIKSMSANGAVTTQYEIDIPFTARSVFMSYRAVRV